MIKFIIGLLIWIFMGLGPYFLYWDYKDRPVVLGEVILFSVSGPIGGSIGLFYYLYDNLDVCIYNCEGIDDEKK